MSTFTRQQNPSPAEVWSAGDYADVCDRMIPRLGGRLVELAGVRAGDTVLDVAAGCGNAALPAARSGAAVTALDITPSLLEAGAQRARSDGLSVDWVQGDAAALPFASSSFDHVLSCVGVQFCSDHEAVASELTRVCRAGGRIALVAWTPHSFIGEVLRAVAAATGAGGAQRSPLDWGVEEKLAALFADRVAGAHFSHEHLQMPSESATAWVDFMSAKYGPLVRARQLLEGRSEWTPLREQLIGIAETHDLRGGDGFSGRAEYLAAVLER